MKRSSIVVLALALITIPVMAKESSDVAIRATDVVFAAAWNHHDATAMAATWAQDGDLVNPFGRVAKGRVAVQAMLQDEHNTAFKSSTYTPGPLSIRFIDPDVAVVESDTAISGIVNPDGTNAPTMNVHILRVIEKRDGKWLTVTARPILYPTAPVAK
ncbi:MAG TPA: SgcJ/EcaC family oxidoreductase [Thermoanaerobaculia bacterium]